TRPVLQGARLTAWELAHAGIACTLIADAAAGSLMRQAKVDLVIVGADRIAANGDFANKIGTYPLAVLSLHHGVPFYCAAPSSAAARAAPRWRPGPRPSAASWPNTAPCCCAVGSGASWKPPPTARSRAVDSPWAFYPAPPPTTPTPTSTYRSPPGWARCATR